MKAYFLIRLRGFFSTGTRLVPSIQEGGSIPASSQTVG